MAQTSYFDSLETRSPETRAADLARTLPAQIARAQALPGYAGSLDGVAPDTITNVEALAALPVLRKDFMVDPWQVAEARALGADAILIIVAALDDGAMVEIERATVEYGMDVLVEVHDRAEMERAALLQSRLIGVNNRDLRTFSTDLATTEALAPLAPEGSLLVGESGIAVHADCTRLARSGVRSFLVGESLMRKRDVAAATRTLLQG